MSKNEKTFKGKILFLDRSDINTDEIIPARYLTEITKEALKPFLLEDLKLEGFNPETDIAEKGVIITRNNFGCGSSREHAPWALEVNGINIVIAEGFARIFRQNMYNCGMYAIELPADEISKLFTDFAGNEAYLAVNSDGTEINISSAEKKIRLPVTISNFDKALINAGGWVEYADSNY